MWQNWFDLLTYVYHVDITATAVVKVLYNSVDVRQEEVLARFCEVIPLHGHTRELVVSGSSAGRGPRPWQFLDVAEQVRGVGRVRKRHAVLWRAARALIGSW